MRKKKIRDRTTEYAELVVSGKRLAGRAEKAACQRHIDDMNNKDFGYIFDVEQAERHIDIANTTNNGEGESVNRFQMRGFQNFILGSLFGWRVKRSKRRRFREAYIQWGRQNGKSLIAGELCNDFCTFSGYHHGRIFCTATKQDQANIVWDEVNKFIQADPELAELYRVREYDRTITSKITGSFIKAIGRDTKSADGFRTILAIVDEYHAHPTNQMYALMLDGQQNVENGLVVAITTAGFNLKSPCHEQYQFAKKVLSKEVSKDSLFVHICEMDEDDDIWEPRNWLKANPYNLWADDTHQNDVALARMAQKAIDAKEKQGESLVNFMTKALNTWVTYSGEAYIDADKWDSCAGVSLEEYLKDNPRRCYLGVDLSSGGDLTSIALVFPSENENAYVWSRSYMPTLRLAEHERTDKVPYRAWVRAGLLCLTNGAYGVKTDYKAILADLAALIQKYNIEIIQCGYDSHNAGAFLADLDEVVGCDLVEIRQSARSLNDATKDFALSVKAKNISYDKGNALLSWSMKNAIVSAPNSFGEIKIDKMTQTERIDPCDALIDAWKLYHDSRIKAEPDGKAALAVWLDATKGSEKSCSSQ